MKYRLVFFASSALIFLSAQLLPAQVKRQTRPLADRAENRKFVLEPPELSILRLSYPDVEFSCEYDDEVSDWKILVNADGRKTDLYWCEGRLLPKEELSDREKYWTLFYSYEKEIKDPTTLTDEEVENIRSFSSPENRKEGVGTPPFFYDILYDCTTRAKIERQIVSHTFLGKRTNCHRRIVPALDKVQKRILLEAEKDAEVKNFVDTLLSADCYSWRQIRDSRNRSFHSVGIAIDLLPRGWGQKNIYWAWRRDIDPKNWMKLPLERRWMPPQKVIEIFEEEGFIWGGKWVIWDNMHFEYHPEIIMKNFS